MLIPISIIGFILGIYFLSFLLGPPALLQDQNTIYYSHTGEIIGEERGSESRYEVDFDQFPTHLIDATIAIEDKRFFSHHGFDFKRITKAIIQNIQHGTLKEGASTITQQYARNLYLTHEKTWLRKIKEASYTIRLEMYYSKEEILAGYLNTVYFGHGSYGIESASRYFFDKHTTELTLAESAMLIGVPKGPTYYSPLNDLDKAEKRKKQILNTMFSQNKITREDHFLAIREHLKYVKKEENNNQEIAPYFQDTVLEEASDLLKLDRDTIKSGGYHIKTTLDTDLQAKLEGKINAHINWKSRIEVGSIAMDPLSGGIRALVGGKSYESSPFNRAIQAKRMVGSTFKPLLYYAALESNYTPSTKLMSKPTRFVLEDDEIYEPRNFNGYYSHDLITLAQAIALSDNIYAVKTNLFLGTEKLIQTAQSFGITEELPTVASLALGTASISLNEMVTAYSRIANGGREVSSYTIEQIADRHGKIVFNRSKSSNKQILNPASTAVLTQLMTGMFDSTLDDYMPVTGEAIADKLTRPYAGKSGSTDSDHWMIGYSPTLVTGVWTGYDDNRNIEYIPESLYAKDIWASFMESAHESQPIQEFSIPPDVLAVRIDPTTGEVATPYCPTTRVMYFKKGTEPRTHCLTHFHHADGEDPEQNKGIFRKIFDELQKKKKLP